MAVCRSLACSTTILAVPAFDCISTRARVTAADPTVAFVDVHLSLSGDHDDEKPFLGDTIEADVKLTMTKAGDAWEVEGYSIEDASINDDDQIEIDVDEDIEGET
jgi:hypothetical protein